MHVMKFRLRINEKNKPDREFNRDRVRFFSLILILLFQNIQQLHLKYQCRIGRDRAAAGFFVCQLWRDDQPGFAPDFHGLQCFGPAGDDLGHAEGRWGAAVDRAIELRAVDQCAGVMDFHFVGRRR